MGGAHKILLQPVTQIYDFLLVCRLKFVHGSLRTVCGLRVHLNSALTPNRLCGFTPFYGDNQRQLFERILHAKFDYPSPEWDDVTATAKDFVSKLLVVNPAERYEY